MFSTHHILTKFAAVTSALLFISNLACVALASNPFRLSSSQATKRQTLRLSPSKIFSILSSLSGRSGNYEGGVSTGNSPTDFHDLEVLFHRYNGRGDNELGFYEHFEDQGNDTKDIHVSQNYSNTLELPISTSANDWSTSADENHELEDKKVLMMIQNSTVPELPDGPPFRDHERVYPFFSRMSRGKRNKKSICCAKGICTFSQICGAIGVDGEEVVHRYLDEYSSVPLSILSFSRQGISQGENCGELNVPIFPVNITDGTMSPEWLHQIKVLGWCPSVLVTRDLGSHTFPSKVVEPQCLCNRERCSKKGVDFRCISVYRFLWTWVRLGGNQYQSRLEKLRVGCVCAQKPSSAAGYITVPHLHS